MHVGEEYISILTVRIRVSSISISNSNMCLPDFSVLAGNYLKVDISVNSVSFLRQTQDLIHIGIHG